MAHRAIFLLIATMFLGAPLAAQDAPPVFKIYLEETGAYRVGFEDLGLADHRFLSHRIGLSVQGKPVPVWVVDGGDGIFGPGDWIEFLGRRLRGEFSYLDEHSRYNVYFLRFDAQEPARMKAYRASITSMGTVHSYRSKEHFEQDIIMLRLPPASAGKREELWYWAKLAHDHSKPFVHSFDLDSLDTSPDRNVRLRIGLRGWSSTQQYSLPDHRVEVSINGTPAEAASWNDTQPYTLEVPPFPASRLIAGRNQISLHVPERRSSDGKPLIDVVMLNWIEIDYPRNHFVGEKPARFELSTAPRMRKLHLESEPERRLVLYGFGGTRIAPAAIPRRLQDEVVASTFTGPSGETSFVALDRSLLRSPDRIVRDNPSRLVASNNHADYLMIAHPRLLPSIEPLAEFHRARGLTVAVVDIEDIYDEFNHGLVHPEAIRDFVDYAYHRWRRPAPRFVLLIGDASWDGKNRQAIDTNYADWTYRPGETGSFVKNSSSPYSEDADLNNRGLIPTWSHDTSEGHSASDNYFVAVKGKGHLPHLAIGRFPVVKPEQVADIVAKTINYISAKAGPWQRNVLLITGEDSNDQLQSDDLGRQMTLAGFAPHKIYPQESEATTKPHTQRLIRAFDEGQLFVHFIGQGDRYIWRTGSPDLAKNHDLFTLDHLDQLSPTDRLPIVLSLTNYSAPFDHPNADSIGEKLLRLPKRGAVAVVAASWRNNPSVAWGRTLFEELTEPAATVGEALMQAKHRVRDREFVATYNLLGDPAVPVARPRGDIDLKALRDSAGVIHVQGEISLDEFAGKVLVELLDDSGKVLMSEALQASGTEFAAQFQPDPHHTTATTVRAYAHDKKLGVDAIGGAVIVSAPYDNRATSPAQVQRKAAQP